MPVTPAMFTSNNDEWMTPPWLFELLDGVFHFNVDLAATEQNALCASYFTMENSAFANRWDVHGEDTRAWLNPAYSMIDDWMEYTVAEYIRAWITVVALVPSRTETGWFQDSFKYARFLYLLRGRLSFLLPCFECQQPTDTVYQVKWSKDSVPFCRAHAPYGADSASSAPFPSCVGIFTNKTWALGPLARHGMIMRRLEG